MIMNQNDISYWLEKGKGIEIETAHEALMTMKTGNVIKVSASILQEIIDIFEDARVYNCFYNLNTIYVPYTHENEESYWLCCLHYVPNKIYYNISNIEETRLEIK